MNIRPTHSTLRRRLGYSLSVAALVPTALLAAMLAATCAAAHATTPDRSTPTAATAAVRMVVCGDDHGTVYADLPKSWHRVLKTSRRCAWEAPDGEHWLMLQARGQDMVTLRAARRAGDGHYTENRWQRQPVWGFENGRVWDHGLTVDGQRNRYRSIGVYDARITYIARHGTFATWAGVFHQARTSSGLAG